MTTIIDGKKVSKEILEEIKAEVATLKDKVVPGLAVILVGEDAGSQVYVKRKRKACADLGFYSEKYDLPVETSEEHLLNLLDELNNKPSIHGILVQLPLPKHINEKKVIEKINPNKDVDGFHPMNQGYLLTGNPLIEPCTPKGVMELLKRYNIDMVGKTAVVIGRSNIVGKPVSIMLQREHATVTMCHSKTKNIADVIRTADIVVAAIGRPKFVKADMVKEGAVIIDVGMNRLDDGKLSGDVDYEGMFDKVSAITPVPGGVGPMTIAMLMKNTLEAAKASLK